MADIYSAAEKAEALRISGGQLYLWFMDLRVPSAGPAMLRLVKNTHDVKFRTDSLGNPLTYRASAFTVAPVRREGSNIPSISVSAENASQVITSALENNNGLIGEFARLQLVNVANLLSGKATWTIQGEVLTSSATARSLSIEIGLFNLMRRNLPGNRAQRDFCRHKYGGLFCGYDTGRLTPTVALQTCDKTKDGANGCTVHGDDEVAASLPRLHPERFGGFPSMLRAGARRN